MDNKSNKKTQSKESAGNSFGGAAKFEWRSGGPSADSGKARASPAFAR